MMNHSNNNNSSSLVLLFLILLFAFCELGSCRNYDFIKMKKTLGGLKGIQNSAEIESIARFAVQEHNKKENSILEFARVVKANEQVVAGKMYHLTLEAIDAGKKKIYEAKVWVKPWMNFKQLQEFKHANDVPLFTSSDLGVIRGSASLYILWKTYDHKGYRTIFMSIGIPCVDIYLYSCMAVYLRFSFWDGGISVLPVSKHIGSG